MAEAEEQYEKIHENLIDVGCDQQTTELGTVFSGEFEIRVNRQYKNTKTGRRI